MFEAAEVGHAVSKDDFDAKEPALREELVEAHARTRKKPGTHGVQTGKRGKCQQKRHGQHDECRLAA